MEENDLVYVPYPSYHGERAATYRLDRRLAGSVQNTELLGFGVCSSSGILETRKLDLFPPSGEGEDTYCWSLRKSQPQSLDCFLVFWNTGRWTKSEIPVIPRIFKFIRAYF
jgi:hypothetical protein